MKTNKDMKKTFKLIFVITIMTGPLMAQTFEVDSINYNITSSTLSYTVEVIAKTPQYTGSVIIPEQVTYDSITYLVTAIGDEAFKDSRELTSVSMPKSVLTIGDEAFDDCLYLTSVSIGISVISIGNYAFSTCINLKTVNIPNTVTHIGNYAFVGCMKLVTINVDSNNPNYSSFEGILYDKNKTTLIQCPAGKSDTVIVGKSVTSISPFAFGFCANLTSISIPETITLIESATFMDCTGITEFIIPNSVTYIGYDAFMNCNKLKSITIPPSVKSVGNRAFHNCLKLETLIISDSLTNIDHGAFKMCRGLTSITSYAKIPPALGLDVFDYVPKTIPVYVPTESVSLYKSADQWKEFLITDMSDISEIQPDQTNVYPNPSNGRFILNSSAGKGKVTIFDLSGKQIYTKEISNNFMEIELPDNACGMYFLQIEEENVGQKTYKVVVR